MNKKTLLNLLLASSICLFVNALAGCILLNLGGLASVVLSILFAVNVRQYFGAEAEDARTCCIISAVAIGAVSLGGTALNFLVTMVTLGLGSILSGSAVSVVNIGFGIWQIVLWSKLKGSAPTPQA